MSTFDTTDDDRVWRPYCCIRNQAAMINCRTSLTANNLEGPLRFEIPSSISNSHRRVIVGVEGYYNSIDKCVLIVGCVSCEWINFNFSYRDRRWKFEHCEIQGNAVQNAYL